MMHYPSVTGYLVNSEMSNLGSSRYVIIQTSLLSTL